MGKKDIYHLEVMDKPHARVVIEIFNHYVENDLSSYFDQRLPESFFERLLGIVQGYPAFVIIERIGNVAGFGFLHAYHPALTLKRTAEATYFIHPDHTRNGLGSLLLNALLDSAVEKGIDNIVASISSLNPASIGFHGKHGFVECGRLVSAGRKFDRDFDVIYMQKNLRSSLM